MKVAVYGAGNQDLYVNQLRLPEKFGGVAPFGGSRMAMEFAKAGHLVYLAEPDMASLNVDQWSAVRSAGVVVTTDDTEAARHAEIAVFFTPFGKTTFRVAKNIVRSLPEELSLQRPARYPLLSSTMFWNGNSGPNAGM